MLLILSLHGLLTQPGTPDVAGSPLVAAGSPQLGDNFFVERVLLALIAAGSAELGNDRLVGGALFALIALGSA